MIPLPPELLVLHENPPVPSEGDNSDLLGWAMQCAANVQQLNEQLRALRNLE